jgi:hypothetical protein
MTQKIVIFNKEGTNPLSVQDYDEQFVANLTAGGIKHRVETIGDNEYFWGDFATGRVVDKHEVPLIDELAIDVLINKEILANYPVHAQLNIMADCLEQSGIPLTEDFIEMRNFIRQKVENHNNAKQVYKENPDVYAFWPKPDVKFDRSKY